MAMDGPMMMGWGGVEERGWRKGPWTPEEDKLLSEHVSLHGEGRWSYVARCTGLNRSGKSCRLRWVNYLKPGLKRGHLTPMEEGIIIELHSLWGNRWSTIARYLPGRTDNDIKNYWRTHFKAKEKFTVKQLKRKAQILKEKQQQQKQLEDDLLEHSHENKKIKLATTTSTTAPQGQCAALACNSELGNDNIIATDELQDLAQAIQSCPALTSITQLGDTSIWSSDNTGIINIGSEDDDQGLWGQLWNLEDDRCHAQANNSVERHAGCNYSECLNRFTLHQNQAMHNGANQVNNFAWGEDIHIDKVFYGGSDYIF